MGLSHPQTQDFACPQAKQKEKDSKTSVHLWMNPHE